jgi:predicted nucleic acid-binding Zn ribbon protein
MAFPFPYRAEESLGKKRFRAAQSSGRDRALAALRGWSWKIAEDNRKPNSKSAGEALKGVLKSLKIDQRLAETEVLKVWNSQMDPNIVAHAHPVGLRNGTLMVTVDSPVWHAEIVRYRRREILERLQNSFGRDVIARISFRIG